MRSTQDPIRGLQKYIEDWGLATEDELKTIDKDSKAEVEKAVEEAKASPEPDMNDFWTDIYYKGTEPPFMRGREREEVSLPWPCPPKSPLTTNSPGSPLLDIISYRFCSLVVRLILPLVEYSHPAACPRVWRIPTKSPMIGRRGRAQRVLVLRRSLWPSVNPPPSVNRRVWDQRLPPLNSCISRKTIPKQIGLFYRSDPRVTAYLTITQRLGNFYRLPHNPQCRPRVRSPSCLGPNGETKGKESSWIFWLPMPMSVRGALEGTMPDTRLSSLSRPGMETKRSRRRSRSICCLAVSLFLSSFLRRPPVPSASLACCYSGYLIVTLVDFNFLLSVFKLTLFLRLPPRRSSEPELCRTNRKWPRRTPPIFLQRARRIAITRPRLYKQTVHLRQSTTRLRLSSDRGWTQGG